MKVLGALGLIVLGIAFQPALVALSFQSAPAPSPNTLVSPASNLDPHYQPSIAVSNINPNMLVALSNVIVGGAANPVGGTSRVAYYFSSDAGATWGTGLIPLETPQETFDFSADAYVASDSEGNFFAAALLGRSSSSGSTDKGIYVFESTDQGQTFGNPVPAFADINDPSPKVLFQPTIAIDTTATSPFKDTQYVAWVGNYSEFDAGVRIAAKAPAATQFSAQQRISHSGDFAGPALATGPNGEIYGAWEGIGNPDHIYFNASTDGGVTFFTDIGTVQGQDFPAHVYVGSLTNAVIMVPGFTRMDSYPTIDVDRSSGPNRGKIYIAWAETTNHVFSDVFILNMAPPNGQLPQPSAPVAVSPSGMDQFFPHLSIDPVSSTVTVAFYDQFDGTGTSVNTFLALSTDGANTFPQKFRISSVASSPSVQSNILAYDGGGIGFGIFLGLQSSCGQSYVAWTDTRDGKQEIFYSSLIFNPGAMCTPVTLGLPNDNCATPQAINSLPATVMLDTTTATSSPTDPTLCSGGQGSNTVWYSVTPAANTTIGVDTSQSNYETVLAVFTGSCGSLSPVACNQAFGNAIGNQSLLVFKAQAGTTYLIEVAGLGSGGMLSLRVGYPTITSVQYTTGPNGSPSLEILGSGFIENNAAAEVEGTSISTVLPTSIFQGQPQADGTATSFFATEKKLKKFVKAGTTITVIVQSPAGSADTSEPFTFTRPK